MPRVGEGYADGMAETFTTGIGTGYEDGLSGSKGCGASGSESGYKWKWRGGADGMDKGMSMFRSKE